MMARTTNLRDDPASAAKIHHAFLPVDELRTNRALPGVESSWGQNRNIRARGVVPIEPSPIFAM
jgi:hypothetical protein